jgi:hypothetical protein
MADPVPLPPPPKPFNPTGRKTAEIVPQKSIASIGNRFTL